MPLRLSTGLRDAMMGATGFKTAMADGVIEVYSGAQPASADAAETGTKLLRITQDSAVFVPEASANGLEFGTPSAGAIAKAVAETWSGVGLAAGVAGWYRFYDNDYVTGASTTAIRFDGACASSGSQFNMSSTTVASGAPITIDSCQYTLPANA